MHYINPNEDEIRIDQSDLIKKKKRKVPECFNTKSKSIIHKFHILFFGNEMQTVWILSLNSIVPGSKWRAKYHTIISNIGWNRLKCILPHEIAIYIFLFVVYGFSLDLLKRDRVRRKSKILLNLKLNFVFCSYISFVM